MKLIRVKCNDKKVFKKPSIQEEKNIPVGWKEVSAPKHNFDNIKDFCEEVGCDVSDVLEINGYYITLLEL